MQSSKLLPGFIYETIKSIVSFISATDVMFGSAWLLFLNKAAWRSAQHDCHDLRRVFAHLKPGTGPSHKVTNLKSSALPWSCNLGQTGFDHCQQRRSFQKIHSSKHQLKLVFSQHFFGINSLKSVPKEVFNQSSSLVSNSPREVFFTEILRRNRQRTCVTRDIHSSR